MKDLPFSVYDFFAYFASGAALLKLIDHAFAMGWFVGAGADVFSITGWVIAAYTSGHIVAQLSGWLIERVVVRRVLGRTEGTFFTGGSGWRARLFPRFFASLPAATQARVFARVPAEVQSDPAALFNHCFAVVKRDPVAFPRMNTFLNLYGFARNIAFVAGVGAAIYARRVVIALMHQKIDRADVLSLCVMVFVGLLMFYRYLNFYWRYSFEMYVTCAEQQES